MDLKTIIITAFILMIVAGCTSQTAAPETMSDDTAMNDEMKDMGSDMDAMDEEMHDMDSMDSEMKDMDAETSMEDMSEEADGMTEEANNKPAASPPSQADVTIVLTGENFKFVKDGEDNPTLTVKKGDRVRIEFSSTDGFHDWALDEFSASTQKVRPGTPTSIEFLADKAGTFEYYCSVGSHRANGMKGAFVVEE